MSNHRSFTHILGSGLFIIGLLLALGLTLIALWPDLEASFFDSALAAERSLENLRCPIILTPAQPGTIQATFSNPHERPVQFLVQASITQGYVSWQREDDTLLQLAPGQVESLAWPITVEDAAYGRLILARIFAFRSAPLPARARTCGILVLNTTFLNGNQIVVGLTGAALVSLGLGGALWLHPLGQMSRQRWRASYTTLRVAFLILLALGASLLGWWAISLILLLLVLLLLAVLIERYFLGR